MRAARSALTIASRSGVQLAVMSPHTMSMMGSTDLVRRGNVDSQMKVTTTLSATETAFKETFTLDDAQLELRTLPELGQIELRSSRIFLDTPAAEAALKASPDGKGLRTYFVNHISTTNRTHHN